MLLCLEVHGTFSISHAILGFKRRERGKGGRRRKGDGGQNESQWLQDGRDLGKKEENCQPESLRDGLLSIIKRAVGCGTSCWILQNSLRSSVSPSFWPFSPLLFPNMQAG